MNDVYTTVIVGGGIAGLYVGMHCPYPQDAAIFEATQRWGGRIETVQMGPFLAEYGPMRIDPDLQTFLDAFIDDLGLSTTDFPPYSADPAREGPAYTLPPEEQGKSTLQLMEHAVLKILGLNPASASARQRLLSMSQGEMDDLRRTGMHRNRELWTQGFWNVLSDVLSHQALQKILTTGSFFHLINENANAADWTVFWVRLLQSSTKLRGLDGGMEQLVHAARARVVQRGVELHSGHTLLGLAPRGSLVELTFQTPEGREILIHCRRVVLALPQYALNRLATHLPYAVQDDLASVKAAPLVKCFFVVKDPWWNRETTPNTRAYLIPTREVYYSVSDDEVGPHGGAGDGMVQIYTDQPAAAYWSPYVTTLSQEAAEINGDPHLLERFEKYLHAKHQHTLHSQTGQGGASGLVGTITQYGIRDWGRPPFGAGVHLWKPGVKSWEVMDRMVAFALTPAHAPNIHICGEAYSDYQGYIEGALRSAQRVLDWLDLNTDR